MATRRCRVACRVGQIAGSSDCPALPRGSDRPTRRSRLRRDSARRSERLEQSRPLRCCCGRRERAGIPEIIEVEAYRRAISATVGRTVACVHAPDEWFAKRGTTTDALRLELTGANVQAVRRKGKLVIVDTDGPRLGLRFGMTGKIVVDGAMPIDHLLYDSPRHEPAWDRFGLQFTDGARWCCATPDGWAACSSTPTRRHWARNVADSDPTAAGSGRFDAARHGWDQRRWPGSAIFWPTRRSGGPRCRRSGRPSRWRHRRQLGCIGPSAEREHPRRTGRVPHRRPPAGPLAGRRLPPGRSTIAPRASAAAPPGARDQE